MGPKMGKDFLYAVLLLMMPNLLSAVTYNNKEDRTSLFSCYSPGHLEGNDTIKLFLSSGDLVVNCYFLTRGRSSEIKENLIRLFTSRGLAPTFKIMNSTYSGVFHFNLTMDFTHNAWLIRIPRETITYNTDIAPIEQWFVSVSLQDGLTTYTTEGTLLDLIREPILQWELGNRISHNTFHKMIPHVKNIRVAKCPCANDVVVLGVVCDKRLEGVYLGLTMSGFWDDNGISWYNLTENICTLLSEDCVDFFFVDVVLTNHHLILLTSLGLFTSEDLRYPKQHLMFSRANFCGFEREDYEQAKLWYHERCLANKEQFEDDYIAITFNKKKTLSQTSTCFYSIDPFIIWNPCLPKFGKSWTKASYKIVSFLIDSEQDTAIYLIKAQKRIYVSVRSLHKFLPTIFLKFPSFLFPTTFHLATGMVFHPRSHFLYVFGNQVWLSTDGGNSFVMVCKLASDPINRTYHSFYSSDIVFLSMSSTVYISKAALGVLFQFKRSDIQKTVVIPGYSSFLLIKLIDYTKALALATMPTRVPFNKTFKENEWLLYDFSMQFVSTWSISPTICNHWIQHDDSATSRSIIKYIDLGSTYNFKIRIIPKMIKGALIFQMPHVEVFTGQPNLMEINSLAYWDETYSYIIEITAINRYLRQGMTSISFVVWQASTYCDTTTIVLTLKSSCSYIKNMHFIPHKKISMSSWEKGIHKNRHGFNMIKTLPENYRPPSHLGIAIPLSNNFYNADPSKPKPRNLFPQSQITGKYKKCFNKSSRAECNCSTAEKFSYSVDFSDCREKVPRYKFPVHQYPISLNILSEDRKELKMEPPFLVTITEVNERGNWKIKQNMPETMTELKKYVESKIFLPVYNPKDLNLSITGSELFHFRVVVIPGVTFCKFYDEFQIYVDDVPQPFPGRILIAITASGVLGGLIFSISMLELYGIKVWKPFKRKLKKIRRYTLDIF
ncbi:cation channel sperm-associated auxiliary subunit beta-like isoform X4 [Macrotis lagotis]|uniref:cation channel sperm-associated auxiliary subunit beta-like isoform X4 n=1 Tax=Macrotis lagotis TaxID=92651 RepID=UPI003D687235